MESKYLLVDGNAQGKWMIPIREESRIVLQIIPDCILTLSHKFYCWYFRCDKTDNLWMNLTDGSIHCGRRNFDGSGGNNHAVDHYEETKYPLVTKLFSITIAS